MRKSMSFILYIGLMLFLCSPSSFAQRESFTRLRDAPQSYKDQAGKCVTVKDNETGLEFKDCGAGGGAPTDAHYFTDRAEGGLSAEVVVSTIGKAVATSTNPGAITFGRANADNTFSWLSDSDFRTAIGVIDWTADQGATNIHSGNLPTLNQSTSGSAASLSISGQTGLVSFTGLTSTNRIKTVRDAADTILELGGSYTPTGTWNWTSVTWSNVPTLNQNTTGTAAGLTAQYIDWNAASGGDSIANKPTIPTVNDSITDSNTTSAPSENAVHDALALKASITTIPYLVGADIALDATGDTSPPVTANRKYVVTATAGVVIASLVDADGDYSDFSNGDRVVLLCQDDEVSFDFTSNTEFGYGGGVDYVCSDTIPTVIEFEFDTVNTRWNVISGLPYGYSDPTTLALKDIGYGSVLTVDGTYSGTTMTMTVDSGQSNTLFGQAYHIDTDGELIEADGDVATAGAAPVFGLAVETGTGSKKILLDGQICETAWNWTIGGRVYLSDDPATTTGLTQTPLATTGDQSEVVGIALSADTILFRPNGVLVEVP